AQERGAPTADGRVALADRRDQPAGALRVTVAALGVEPGDGRRHALRVPTDQPERHGPVYTTTCERAEQSIPLILFEESSSSIRPAAGTGQHVPEPMHTASRGRCMLLRVQMRVL